MVWDWEMVIFFGSNMVNMFSLRILRVHFLEFIEWFMQGWKRLMVCELSIWEDRGCCCCYKGVATLRRTVSGFWCCVLWWCWWVEKWGWAATLRAWLRGLILAKGMHFFLSIHSESIIVYINIYITVWHFFSYWIS